MKKFLNRQWRKDSGSHHLGPGKKTVEEIGKQPIKDGPGWQMTLDGRHYVGTCEFTFPKPYDPQAEVIRASPMPSVRDVKLGAYIAPEGVWWPFGQNGSMDDARLAALGFLPLGTMSEDSEIEVRRAQA